MKHINIFFIVLGAALLVLTGCSTENNLTGPAQPVVEKTITAPVENSIKQVSPGKTAVYPIWADKGNYAGTISIMNDTEYFYVIYNVLKGWSLNETYVHHSENVNGIPVTKDGMPDLKKFEYTTLHKENVNRFTYIIPLGNEKLPRGRQIVIAANAKIENLENPGSKMDLKTAWGGNEPGPGPAWWNYIHYNVMGNEGPGIVIIRDDGIPYVRNNPDGIQ